MTPAPDHAAEVVRRRYHASAGSVLYILTTVFLAIGAVNSQNNLLFWAFGIAIGGLLISGLISGPAMMGLRVRREMPASAQVGRPMVVRYAVHNGSRVSPAFGLTIEEERAGVRGNEAMGAPVAAVGHVGPGEMVWAQTKVVPRRRGAVTFSRFLVWTTFPFGLAKKSVLMGQGWTVVVRPRVWALRRDALGALVGTGARLTSSRNIPGVGEDVYGLRDYQPGDSIRTIAWRATARAGTPVVRQTAMPAPTRLWVVIGPSVRGLPDHLREGAISLAASAATDADARGFSVGLDVPWLGVRVLPSPGKRHVDRLLDTLAELDLDATVDGGRGATAGRRDASVLIASGEDDRGGAPPGAVRLDPTAIERYVLPGSVLPREPGRKRSRVGLKVREFLGMLEDEPEEADEPIHAAARGGRRG